MTKPFKFQATVPVVAEVNITTSVMTAEPLAEAYVPVPPVNVT